MSLFLYMLMGITVKFFLLEPDECLDFYLYTAEYFCRIIRVIYLFWNGLDEIGFTVLSTAFVIHVTLSISPPKNHARSLIMVILIDIKIFLDYFLYQFVKISPS